MATIDVKDAAGVTRTIQAPDADGRAAAASSRPVVLSTEDQADLQAVAAAVGTLQSSFEASAAVRTIDSVSSTVATDAVMNGLVVLTPKFAKISVSANGDNTLVAAVSGKKIRVLAYNFIGNGAVNPKFQSGSGGTDLTGYKYIASAGGGICAPFNPVGWFETTAGVLLNLNLSAAVGVGGELVYVEV